MRAYQHQNATMTLEAGLAEYYAAFPGLKRGPDLSPEARAFFAGHDAVHVLYGCDTSMNDEAVVKLASITGTTAGWNILRAYGLHDVKDIYASLRLREIVRTLLALPVIVPRTLLRCRRQTRPWPWTPSAAALRTPLHRLRADYGIVVAHASGLPEKGTAIDDALSGGLRP